MHLFSIKLNLKENKPLKITAIEICPSSIKLRDPFVISLGVLEYAQNVYILIHTDTGLVGYGECSPFLSINGESMDTCVVVGGYLAKSLIGKDPLQIAACSKQMDQVIFGNSSIKSAFDIALYDIASKHANLPLYEFLGGSNDTNYYTDFTVSLGEVSKMVTDALDIVKRGFKYIKVKLGESGDSDLERIRAIRSVIGQEIPLRLDANQGWSTEEAIKLLKDLEHYNIQYCEEPIIRGEFRALAEIKKYTTIPIMADESCCSPSDARKLIDFTSCDMFNIKLGKSSGIYHAQNILRLAEQHFVDVQIGGFLESRLGFTASAHLALSSEAVKYVDFDTPMMFEEDPVNGGIQYGSNGKIILPEETGLGASIDQAHLDNLKRIIY